METHLLLREYPRALALRPTVLEEAPSGVLVFEEYKDLENRAVTKLVGPAEFENSQWRILTSRPVFGCLGLITVQNECFVAIVTDCVSVGRIRVGEEVYKIQSVSFYSLSSSRYDNIADVLKKEGWDGEDMDQPSAIQQHPCTELQKLFSLGNFYFTPDFDLTKTVQTRTSAVSSSVLSFDQHFLWNQFLISGLLEFRSTLDKIKQLDLDRGGFLIFAIRGFIGTETITLNGERHELSVISKLSCLRAGTRFNSRGIDDNGHVANFVETETILYSDSICYSYTQIRGSVPVFWEQQALQLIQHRIQISRGSDAAQPAVKRHFDELVDRYDSVCNINLLSQREAAGESVLSKAYITAINQLDVPKNNVDMVHFDLHTECRGGNYDNLEILMRDIRMMLDTYGYFLMDTDENQMVCPQKGVFRTNCMDCLDRTNLVQNEISKGVLMEYLHNRFRDRMMMTSMETLVTKHSHLWAENGDSLSKIYAGTGALKSSFTRTGKVTFMNVLGDATRSVNRFYINNFQDKARQEVIDQLLGKLSNQVPVKIHDPISDSVAHQLSRRIQEYSSSRAVTIFCGTYNLDGKSFRGELLDPWLLQHHEWNEQEPDIYALGIQEIVELSPQQVMSADEEKRKFWEQQIESTLNRHTNGKTKYSLLRSNQLMGEALIIFAKSNIVGEIRNVETTVKKTGMMGVASNKGAIAIRMDYGDTSFCFVAAHFASGKSNVDDRNSDFHTINNGIKFLKGRTIDSHENVIWMSDLNYRISLSNEEARMYIDEGNIEALHINDQLYNEILHNRVFQNYQEGDITFLPTYKFDIWTDMYDTSEKQKVPAWTDRVLFKGKQLKQLQYARAELYTSDHRPVFALFEAKVTTLNHDAKTKLQKQLYQSLSNVDTSSLAIRSGPSKRKNTTALAIPGHTPTDSFVDTLIDLAFDANDLPSPSSESNNWWDDGTAIPKADKGRASDLNPFHDSDSTNNSSVKLPASFQSDNDWTALSPVFLANPTKSKKDQ